MRAYTHTHTHTHTQEMDRLLRIQSMERRLAAWAAEMARRERAVAEREAGLCAWEAALRRREAAAAAESAAAVAAAAEEEEESLRLPALLPGSWQVGRG